MKKIIMIAVALMTLGINANAQDLEATKELVKERQVLAKASKKQLTARASKAARKEAKQYKKNGWEVNPGALPMDKQLDRAYQMQYEFEENMMPKYIMGEARSIGETYDAAKMQALELAKQNLAAQIQTEITALIENTVANRQLAQEEAASITESVLSSKNLISQNIGRTINVVEVYRTLPNKNKEVLVRIGYNTKMAMEAARSSVREDLEKKGHDLHKKLDEALGF
jgi:hypothetical protein